MKKIRPLARLVFYIFTCAHKSPSMIIDGQKEPHSFKKSAQKCPWITRWARFATSNNTQPPYLFSFFCNTQPPPQKLKPLHMIPLPSHKFVWTIWVQIPSNGQDFMWHPRFVSMAEIRVNKHNKFQDSHPLTKKTQDTRRQIKREETLLPQFHYK